MEVKASRGGRRDIEQASKSAEPELKYALERWAAAFLPDPETMVDISRKWYDGLDTEETSRQ